MTKAFDKIEAGLNEALEIARGDVEGLYGRLAPELQRLVRKIMDAPNYDYGAMELLDAFEIEWRK